MGRLLNAHRRVIAHGAAVKRYHITRIAVAQFQPFFCIPVALWLEGILTRIRSGAGSICTSKSGSAREEALSRELATSISIYDPLSFDPEVMFSLIVRNNPQSLKVL